jgi:hypothetical protein
MFCFELCYFEVVVMSDLIAWVIIELKNSICDIESNELVFECLDQIGSFAVEISCLVVNLLFSFQIVSPILPFNPKMACIASMSSFYFNSDNLYDGC